VAAKIALGHWKIDGIYERGAPIASTVMTKFAAEFVQEMRALVRQAVVDGGGRLEAHMVVAGPKPGASGSRSPKSAGNMVGVGGEA
jgi:hypothetical protein